MNASVAIKSVPGVLNEKEIIRIVDEVIEYIQQSGCSYSVGASETTIEGEYETLMEIIKQCQYVAIKAGAPSVDAYVKISYKPQGEIMSIEKKLFKYI